MRLARAEQLYDILANLDAMHAKSDVRHGGRQRQADIAEADNADVTIGISVRDDHRCRNEVMISSAIARATRTGLKLSTSARLPPAPIRARNAPSAAASATSAAMSFALRPSNMFSSCTSSGIADLRLSAATTQHPSDQA